MYVFFLFFFLRGRLDLSSIDVGIIDSDSFICSARQCRLQNYAWKSREALVLHVFYIQRIETIKNTAHRDK